MTLFALDTNILSYLLKKDGQVFARLQAEISDGNECVIPPIAYYEIRRGLLAVNASTQLQLFDELCRAFPVGETTILTWKEAANLYAQLRRQGRTIEDADLLIAAFCIVNTYTLVTNNMRHFEFIDALHCVNWK